MAFGTSLHKSVFHEIIENGIDDKKLDDQRLLCPLCLQHVTKYTCPRCNTPYCSLNCYQSDKHKNCSESFYKDCFMEGLKECSADHLDKQKVIEMLKRSVEELDVEDLDKSDESLHKRLADIDIDTDVEQVWNLLTEEEKQEFHAMAGDGRLGKLIEVWTPWWLKPHKELVTVVSECVDLHPVTRPSILSHIPIISQLTKSQPSAHVKFNVLHCLFVYAYVCRLYNGEHISMASESYRDFLALSDVLQQDFNSSSVDEAIQICLCKLQFGHPSYKTSAEQNISLCNDVEHIICVNESSPLINILSALSDMYYLFKKAKKHCSKKEALCGHSQGNQKKKTKLFHCVKKCVFMLSWAHTYGMALVALVPELQILCSRLISETESVNQSKKQLEFHWGGTIKQHRKKLIEEI